MKLIMMCLLVVGMLAQEFDMPVKKNSPDEIFMQEMKKKYSLVFAVLQDLYKANCYNDYNSFLKFSQKALKNGTKSNYGYAYLMSLMKKMVLNKRVNDKSNEYIYKLVINSSRVLNCNDNGYGKSVDKGFEMLLKNK